MDNQKPHCMIIKIVLHLFVFCVSFWLESSDAVLNNPPIHFNSSLALPSEGLESGGLQTYIIHVTRPKSMVFASSEDRQRWHRSLLPNTIVRTEERESRMVFSYEHAMDGFAARLTVDEAIAIQDREEVLLVRPQSVFSPQTTHSPYFVGLERGQGVWKDSNMGQGIIIGVLDTGIGDLEGSFGDDLMPPPPRTWKGVCQLNGGRCNNKVIGARSRVPGVNPTDVDGHGTHVAGTAAGTFVQNANVAGAANGIAAGTAPLAYLSIYKVCHKNICEESIVIKGLDDAIEDEVDVINLSIGNPPKNNYPFYNTFYDIGSYRAVQKNIAVVYAAGNFGPNANTISHEAPWYLTVGATTTDRSVNVAVLIGNGDELAGEGVFDASALTPSFKPLVFPGSSGSDRVAMCEDGSLSGMNVVGKIVLCKFQANRVGIGPDTVVKNAGGLGMIVMNSPERAFSIDASYYDLPSTYVSYSDGMKIQRYITIAGTKAIAKFEIKGTMFTRSPALMVLAQSSRGPSTHGGMLKPDIVGPGVSILAQLPGSYFGFSTGTSMAAPHISGIAALLKKLKPTWRPSEIMSAIMTTADTTDKKGKLIIDQQLNEADPFAIGAGQVNALKAIDPGLVYRIPEGDYALYLCGLGYSDSQVLIITGDNTFSCRNKQPIVPEQLNYPSFYVQFSAVSTHTVTRKVKNVGNEYRYTVQIKPPPGVDISVSPTTLTFSPTIQDHQLTYTVVFKQTQKMNVPYGKGSLQWVSASRNHVVWSPIVVKYY